MWGKFVYRGIAAPERVVLIHSFSDEAGGITRYPMAPTWPREMFSTFTLETKMERRSRRSNGFLSIQRQKSGRHLIPRTKE